MIESKVEMIPGDMVEAIGHEAQACGVVDGAAKCNSCARGQFADVWHERLRKVREANRSFMAGRVRAGNKVLIALTGPGKELCARFDDKGSDISKNMANRNSIARNFR